jgi:hypothetical protein
MRTTALTFLLTLVVAGPAAGQAPQGGSWLAWHGCWRAAGADALEGQILCVLPGADRMEARFVTFADGVMTGSTAVRADGAPRPVEEGGCTGTESARWSGDGRRVLLRGELDCDGVRRISTGAIAMVAENEWVDVQAATVGDQHASRVLRYRPAGEADVPAEAAAALDRSRGLAREAARLNAAARLEVEDVIDAARYLETPALQALLAAYGSGFTLDARALARLEDAGLDPSVLDIMVALTYPERFAIREGGVERDESVYRQRGYAWEDECWDPVFRRYYWGADCYYRSPFGYSRWGYSRWGYSPWGYDPWGWRYGTGTVVVVVPVGDPPPATQQGSLVKGGGYTRGGASSGTARPRTGTGSGGGAQTGTATGSAAPAARSGGSSSSGSGRTAQPRSGSSGGGGAAAPAMPATGSTGGHAIPSGTGGDASGSGSGSSGSSGSSDRTAQPRPGGGDTPPAS